MQINGTGFIYNGWLLDGTDITEYEQGGTNVQPNVDALQEFKVLSANMPAEYGHTPNFVSATMKSGTNEFHGTLFEFIRNDKVDARNFFAATKNALRRNQFGGTVGGPIVKNKVFFFADMEKPTSARRRCSTMFFPPPPCAQVILPGRRPSPIRSPGAPFPGNIIPANRISPQAAFFLKYMPSQSAGHFQRSAKSDISKGDVKIDGAGHREGPPDGPVLDPGQSGDWTPTNTRPWEFRICIAAHRTWRSPGHACSARNG